MCDSTELGQRNQQRAKAAEFCHLHHGGKILVLPNVWDAASARSIEDAGFPAIATTSAGIAYSLGYADGQKISRQEMIEAIKRITRAVEVPLSADVEGGYGDRPEDAALTARQVIEAGAVGLNLEDGTNDPNRPLLDLSLQVEKLAAVREASDGADVPLLINARTDVYLIPVGAPEKRYELALGRAQAFQDAGAGSIFLPGLVDRETIRRFVADLKLPLNILAGPGSPPIPELEAMGVARVSLGSGPMRATLGLLKRLVEELRTSGTYEALDGAPSHAEVNRLMSRAK